MVPSLMNATTASVEKFSIPTSTSVPEMIDFVSVGDVVALIMRFDPYSSSVSDVGGVPPAGFVMTISNGESGTTLGL
jgi:hypothetical protein